MTLKDKILNRYNIIVFVMFLLMFLLVFRLAILTIAQGDYYRDIADNKRLREVYVTAPRGEIRDRHGRLLAGNKPSFTVQLLKDEINLMTREDRNETFLEIIRLLEEDGVSYIDDFPIELNKIVYNSVEAYLDEISNPLNKAIDIVIENNLVASVLDSTYINREYEDHYKFIMADRAIALLEAKGMDIPIYTELNGDKILYKYKEGKDIASFKDRNQLGGTGGPLEDLSRLIVRDKNDFRKVVDNSMGRYILFKELEARNLSSNLALMEYSISHLEEHTNQKVSLMREFPNITMETTALEDFIYMFKEVSLEGFLETSFEREDEVFVPAKILLDIIREDGREILIDYSLDDSNNVMFNYYGDQDLGDKNIVDLLVESLEDGDLENFLSHNDIKILAQSQLLRDGVNPRISVAGDIEYVNINNLNSFYAQHRINSEDSLEEAFEKIRSNYRIDEGLSKYEARAIMIMQNEIRKQGYRAYQPINIAYGITDSTVAKIEEITMEVAGVNVSIEPVRYYPENKSAAHILGYLGKISQANEIERYVNELGYSPNAIIGKTGIEHSFEEILSGQSGIKRVEVDSLGNTTNVISEEKPVPGDNIYLTIDLKLQQVAEQAMEDTLEAIQRGGTYRSPWGDYQFGINNRKGKPYDNATSGAVVAIDVKTGEVLASVSYPSYDPNLFSTGISNADWLSLFPENPEDTLAPRPLYNIATQTAVQPGSVFKMVTALAALENGLSPDHKIRDMGYVEIGNSRFHCLAWTQFRTTHGLVDVYDAIKDSCNYYFYSLALGENQRTGQSLGMKVTIEDIVDLSKKFGLNDRTGIEISIPREVSGGVPNPQRKIIATKNSLRFYLNNNIEKFYMEDLEYTDEDKTSLIDEIVSWTEYDVPLSRGEVIRRLRDLNLEPERVHPGEREGLADRIKFTYLNFAGWNISDTLNVTIGQGQSSYTPIQMANYIATLSNGGYRHELTLIDSIKNYNNSQVREKHEPNPERIELNDYSNLDHIKRGMLLTSESGTGARIFRNFPVQVGSKTGTAERSGVNPITGETYDNFAWFVAFAPYDDPEIAVASVIFQGGSGGYAGPLVRDIIAQHLGLNEVSRDESLPFESFLTR